MPDELRYSDAFWNARLPLEDRPADLEGKLELVLSLVMYLSLSFGQLLLYIFSSTNTKIKNRASRFLGYHTNASDPNHIFYPSTIYNIWHERWPKSHQYLHARIIEPCAREIAVAEGDSVIKEPTYQVKISTLTIACMRRLLRPAALIESLRAKAPFTFGYLHAFTTAPNEYRTKQARQQRSTVTPGGGHSATNTSGPSAGLAGLSDEDVDWMDDPNVDSEDAGLGRSRAWEHDYPGFSQNPLFVSMLSF